MIISPLSGCGANPALLTAHIFAALPAELELSEVEKEINAAADLILQFFFFFGGGTANLLNLSEEDSWIILLLCVCMTVENYSVRVCMCVCVSLCVRVHLDKAPSFWQLSVCVCVCVCVCVRDRSQGKKLVRQRYPNLGQNLNTNLIQRTMLSF